ncbi:MinD/ParA family protein [bacterium]|nr:MinD/ParA family protein [FCB group bacterium]MBL7191232.1 MinD/ParA family protein [bacterium]
MLDQASRLRELASIDKQKRGGAVRTRRIAVTSGKGGVGKSNFSLNLAVLASKLNRKVLLIDADTNLANIDILLGISPEFNLSHVISGYKSVSEILVKGPERISILPAASGDLEQVFREGLASEAIISDLNNLEDDYELIVIDTGAGIARNVLDFVTYADTVVIITTSEPTAITDAYAMVKVLSMERTDPQIKILVNMVRDKHEAMDVFDKLSAVINHFLKLDVEYLGFIPRDVNVENAVHHQKPLVLEYPKTPASIQMKFITRRLVQGEYIADRDGSGLFGNIFRKMMFK